MHMLLEGEIINPCLFKIKISGVVIEIRAQYASTYFLCHDYLTNEDPTIHVSITKEDINRAVQNEEKYYYTCKEFVGLEKNRDISKEINESVIEPIIIYRKIIEELLVFDFLFIHGAVVATGNKAFMFTAPSGTGKTTHIMKWIHNANEAYILNGDKPLFRISDTSIDACGNPWCGKEFYGKNAVAPLKAIVLMERSNVNHIEEISFSKAYTFLLRQIYLPEEAEKAKKTLNLLSLLNGRVRFYKFFFNNFSDDCFDVSYNVLTAIE